MSPRHDAAARPAVVEVPTVGDGAALWRMAGECGLDRNSPYKYLLFCRDFADTSAVARVDGATAGFVTGYLRPGTDTLFVWQVGVADRFRGRGLASAMLDELVRRGTRPRFLEATVTPDNAASWRLFRGFAATRGATVAEEPLFGSELFPEPHPPEVLIRIGPLRPGAT